MSCRMAIFAVILSAVSCGGSGKSPGGALTSKNPTCEDLSSQAFDTLTNAAMSVSQCTFDSDCKEITNPADCLSSCVNIVGNDNVQAAIASKADEIASLCAQFHHNGCVVSEGGCPARPKSFVCQMSQCVFQ